MMLIAVVCLALSVSAGQEPDAKTQAERLARGGSHQEALKRFQALAAVNPDDVDARLWIGRLHLLLGHPQRAAAVFESIVAIQGQNVEALTGLGLALIETGDRRAAADALNRAEALAAERVDVLAAQGQLHAADGRDTLALAYYGRALASDPNNATIQAKADALRASRAHRVEVGYDTQSFDPSVGAFHAGRVEINARLNEAFRVFTRGQILRHDGDDEIRGGAGIEWTVGPSLQLRGGAQFGSSTFRLPKVDAFADATFVRGRASWTLRGHFFDFDGVDLWIGGPGVGIEITPRMTLVAEYLHGRVSPAPVGSDTVSSGLIGLHGRLTPVATGFVEYHRGLDRLDWFTIDRIGAKGANTVSVGGAADLTPFVGLGARYDYQERRDNLKVHKASAHFTFRF